MSISAVVGEMTATPPNTPPTAAAVPNFKVLEDTGEVTTPDLVVIDDPVIVFYDPVIVFMSKPFPPFTPSNGVTEMSPKKVMELFHHPSKSLGPYLL